MSITAARKDRERAAREDLIVEHARRLLARDGFQDLNLDELAASVEYSKGTIYLHFETKEDLALAVVTRTLKEQADLLDRGAAFCGTSRERMRALSIACCQFAATHPDYFSQELMLRARSFWERASQERQRLHFLQTSRLFHTVNNIVLAAIACGDLPAGTRSQDVTLSLIAVTMGSHCAVARHDFTILCGIDDPLAALRVHHDKMLDGWNWRPLSEDLDLDALDRRIRQETFPEATWMRAQ